MKKWTLILVLLGIFSLFVGLFPTAAQDATHTLPPYPISLKCLNVDDGEMSYSKSELEARELHAAPNASSAIVTVSEMDQLVDPDGTDMAAGVANSWTLGVVANTEGCWKALNIIAMYTPTDADAEDEAIPTTALDTVWFRLGDSEETLEVVVYSLPDGTTPTYPEGVLIAEECLQQTFSVGIFPQYSSDQLERIPAWQVAWDDDAAQQVAFTEATMAFVTSVESVVNSGQYYCLLYTFTSEDTQVFGLTLAPSNGVSVTLFDSLSEAYLSELYGGIVVDASFTVAPQSVPEQVVLPTNTFTPTFTPSFTPMPPSETPSPEPTDTNTATFTPSYTPVPPSETPTETATNTATNTATDTATATNTNTATATLTRTPRPTRTPSSTAVPLVVDNAGTMNLYSDGGSCDLGYRSGTNFAIDLELAEGASVVIEGTVQFTSPINRQIRAGYYARIDGPAHVVGQSRSWGNVCISSDPDWREDELAQAGIPRDFHFDGGH